MREIGKDGKGGETNACTWRKGSCSFVEDIILSGRIGFSQALIYRRLSLVLILCAAKGRCSCAHKQVGFGSRMIGVRKVVGPIYAVSHMNLMTCRSTRLKGCGLTAKASKARARGEDADRDVWQHAREGSCALAPIREAQSLECGSD